MAAFSIYRGRSLADDCSVSNIVIKLTRDEFPVLGFSAFQLCPRQYLYSCTLDTLNVLALCQERRVAERINRQLKQQLANYKVPDVMEYVEEKANLYELQKKVKSWQRKVDIASVSCLAYLLLQQSNVRLLLGRPTEYVSGLIFYPCFFFFFFLLLFFAAYSPRSLNGTQRKSATWSEVSVI